MSGIIVGVDDSPSARAALRWAADHSSLSAATVTAVMAWGHDSESELDDSDRFDPVSSGSVAFKVLDEIVARALGDERAADVELRAVCDRPGRALLHAGQDASMIVVGARGMGGFRGLLLGSVSRFVLHGATCPVAVVRNHVAAADGPIVVGVDGSEHAQRALRWAVDHARASRLPLVAVHASHLLYTGVGYEVCLPEPTVLAAEADRFLHRQVDQVDARGLVSPIQCRVVADRASATLVDASRTASLVVVGSRGHGPLSSVLLGSVGDQVAHHAASPVVVVP